MFIIENVGGRKITPISFLKDGPYSNYKKQCSEPWMEFSWLTEF